MPAPLVHLRTMQPAEFWDSFLADLQVQPSISAEVVSCDDSYF